MNTIRTKLADALAWLSAALAAAYRAFVATAGGCRPESAASIAERCDLSARVRLKAMAAEAADDAVVTLRTEDVRRVSVLLWDQAQSMRAAGGGGPGTPV